MIEVKNISKSFGDKLVLNNISCTFEPGKIYGIIGINGVGKSTLLRIINGIYDQNQGQVLLDGKVIKDNAEVKENICFVSDDAYFFKGYTLDDMASFYNDMYENFSEKNFKYFAETLNLDTHQKMSNFSKGMKRQSSLILCLATNAKYMFFDETFDGLDPLSRNKMKNHLMEYAKNGNTIIMTSHNMKELEDICDSIAVLEQGKMLVEGEFEQKLNKVFKLQIVENEEISKETLGFLELLDYKKEGKVITIVTNGEKEDVISRIKKLAPLLVEEIPLTLEEMFIYEKEGNK